MRHLATLRLISDVGRSGSIRRSAERLHITPSALTRKIQDFEAELGTPVFERLRSRLADLAGARRGHVAIACSQAFVDRVLPAEIQAYRKIAPYVTFSVQVRDHAQGVAALSSFDADLALLVDPPAAPDMDVLLTGHQPVYALMHKEHPAAAPGPIRLRDCFAHPVAMPDNSLAIRGMLDAARVRLSQPIDIRLESGSLELLRNYVLREKVISFQISAGIPAAMPGMHMAPIDRRDLPPATIVLGRLRGRAPSVAAAKFAYQLSHHPLWS